MCTMSSETKTAPTASEQVPAPATRTVPALRREGAIAIGAVAVAPGALALGAVAIGKLAIGQLALGGRRCAAIGSTTRTLPGSPSLNCGLWLARYCSASSRLLT